MGVSTDGIICYGIALEEDVELPWDDHEHNDSEEWWMEQQGYDESLTPFPDTALKNSDPDEYERMIEEWREHRNDFRDSMETMPFEEVFHCSGNYPMTILAVSGMEWNASRGYPEELDLDMMRQLEVDSHQGQELVDFVKKYKIDIGKEHPKWILCSYWG